MPPVSTAKVSTDEDGALNLSPERGINWSGQRRFKYFVTGILFPSGCIGAAWWGQKAHIDPPWQSGELEVFAGLLLEIKSLLPFLPLLLFSMLALGTLCVSPQHARRAWVQVGICGGALLSAQYLVVVLLATYFFTLAGAAIVAPCLALGTAVMARLLPRARRVSILQIMLLTAVVAVLFAGAAAIGEPIGILQIFFGGLFFILIATPALTCATFVRAAVDLYRCRQPIELRRGNLRFFAAFATIWGLGWLANWKFALDTMLSEYAKLPTTDPSCYVSAAAACGHRRFVGVAQFAAAEPACVLQRGVAEKVFPVNLQMCRLKFLELALAALSPRLHRILRRVYNSVGPKAARVCRHNVWFADTSYIALKPIEFAAFALQIAGGVSQRKICQLYCRLNAAALKEKPKKGDRKGSSNRES